MSSAPTYRGRTPSQTFGGNQASQEPWSPGEAMRMVNDPFGPTPVEQTFTQDATPYWMQAPAAGQSVQQPGAVPGQQQNWFEAPWWGTNAATGAALQQGDVQAAARQLQDPNQAQRWAAERDAYDKNLANQNANQKQDYYFRRNLRRLGAGQRNGGYSTWGLDWMIPSG